MSHNETEQQEEDSFDEDEVTELNLQEVPSQSSQQSKRSPSLRRHKSEAAVYFEKLGIFESISEQKDTEESKNNNDNNNASSSINVSAFSKDPKQFALELQRMIESIINQKELPPKNIMIALLNVLNFWILNHGINSINELEEFIYKYESMQSENTKQKMISQHKIDEYKNEYDEYQKRKESLDNNNEQLVQRLNEAEQQLKSANFLKEQILTLEKELEEKNNSNDSNLKQRTLQQKQINTLTTDKMQLQKLIDSQKSQLSKMNGMDNELKIKSHEIKEIKKKYKLIENELLQIRIEKEELYKEKKDMQNKLTDYGKLKANLNELENNQTQYIKTINSLNKTNIKLNNTINELENDLENDLENMENKINLNEEDESKQINENLSTNMETKTMLFVDFTSETQTYNTEKTPRIAQVITPKFDDEIKKDLKEFELTIGNDVNDINISEEKKETDKRETNVFTSRNMYRSFVIVGFSCLCYLMYTQYWNGTPWQKAKQMRDKYKKWQKGVGMKKRVIKKQSLRQ